ncbi:MAG: alpha/beta fold hydrolase, partial [Candidatus Falkowbacteria bacterium]
GIMQGENIGWNFYKFILPHSYPLEIGADYYFQTNVLLFCFHYHNEHAVAMCGVQADGSDQRCAFNNQDGFEGAGIKTIVSIAEPEPDPVILVPGIMGSWNVSGRWQIDPIFHTYDNLMEALMAAGYKEDSLSESEPNLFTFPYDWRVDNNITADLLKAKINLVKEITGRDKVDIIAHSMGGLVARSYVEGDDYQNDIDQIIFLGTPHQGSPESYLKYEGAEGFFTTGEKLTKYLFQTEAAFHGYFDLTDYIRAKVLTVAQLLPIYDYLKDKQPDSTYQIRPYPLNYPQNNYLENLNSQANIDLLKQRAKVTNIVSDLGADSTLNYLRVVADPDTTDNKWQSGYPENLGQNLNSLEMGAGDDTVPLISADSLSGVETILSATADHTNLPTIMQKQVVKTLTGQEPADYFNSKIAATIKRWVFFRVYSPVDLAVIAPDGSKIGKNFTDNTEVNEIPDAFYSGFNGHEEFILIPNPQDGEYKIEVQGVDNGGEYILANSLIDGDEEVGREYSGSITPGQKRDFVITYSATSEDPLGEIELIDNVPPVVIITKPVKSEKYLHSNNLIIDYSATDDFAGLAATTITIDDRKIATTTVNLFDYSLGQHSLIITAIDKAGNQAQAQVNFEIIADIDSTISDIKEIYERGWLKKGIYRALLENAFKLLKIEAKFFEREQKLTEKLIKKTEQDHKLSAKQKQKQIEQYNKKLAEPKKNRAKAIDKSLDLIVKLLNKAKDKNQINQRGYDIILSDINYLRINL